MKALILMLVFLLLVPFASAQDSADYYMIIEDNGNTLVTVTITGSGLYTLPIPQDAEDIMVRGGLYLRNGNSIDVSIGDTGQAVVLYTTGLLTTKTGNEWIFEMSLKELGNKNVIILMPAYTIITSTTPHAQVKTGEITELYWGDVSSVTIEYHFEKGETKPPLDNAYVYALILSAIIIIIIASLKFRKRGISRKESVVKTLSENERKVVQILMENKGVMRRSKLEKESGISKSSLAVCLNNLEKKKIVEVDKRYPVHSVKFTEWFNEL